MIRTLPPLLFLRETRHIGQRVRSKHSSIAGRLMAASPFLARPWGGLQGEGKFRAVGMPDRLAGRTGPGTGGEARRGASHRDAMSWTQAASLRGHELLQTVISDHKNFYSLKNAAMFAAALGVGAISANTSIDGDIRDWYQDFVRSGTTDDVSKVVKNFGEWTYTVPAFFGVAVLGELTKSTKPKILIHECFKYSRGQNFRSVSTYLLNQMGCIPVSCTALAGCRGYPAGILAPPSPPV
jgi:hypothetical protein